MIEDIHRDLIDREIDGENTPNDSAELNRLLAQRPELAAYYDRMKQVAEALDPRSMVDPPAGLKERILAAVRPVEMRAVHEDRRRSPSEWMASLFTMPRLRYATIMAAGIAVGFLGAALGLDGRLGSRPTDSGAAGTMISAPTGATTVSDRVPFDLGKAAGLLTLASGRGRAEVRLDTRGDGPLTLELSVDPNSFRLEEWRRESGLGELRAEIVPGRVLLSQAGDGVLRIAWSTETEMTVPIAYRIECGERAASGTLTVN